MLARLRPEGCSATRNHSLGAQHDAAGAAAAAAAVGRWAEEANQKQTNAKEQPGLAAAAFYGTMDPSLVATEQDSNDETRNPGRSAGKPSSLRTQRLRLSVG
jgi:hypothetical protein